MKNAIVSSVRLDKDLRWDMTRGGAAHYSEEAPVIYEEDYLCKMVQVRFSYIFFIWYNSRYVFVWDFIGEQRSGI